MGDYIENLSSREAAKINQKSEELVMESALADRSFLENLQIVSHSENRGADGQESKKTATRGSNFNEPEPESSQETD